MSSRSALKISRTTARRLPLRSIRTDGLLLLGGTVGRPRADALPGSLVGRREDFYPPAPFRKVPIYRYASQSKGKSTAMSFSTHVLPGWSRRPMAFSSAGSRQLTAARM